MKEMFFWVLINLNILLLTELKISNYKRLRMWLILVQRNNVFTESEKELSPLHLSA